MRVGGTCNESAIRGYAMVAPSIWRYAVYCGAPTLVRYHRSNKSATPEQFNGPHVMKSAGKSLLTVFLLTVASRSAKGNAQLSKFA